MATMICGVIIPPVNVWGEEAMRYLGKRHVILVQRNAKRGLGFRTKSWRFEVNAHDLA